MVAIELLDVCLSEEPSDGWADSWTIGYGLDGGGYAFERVTNGPTASRRHAPIGSVLVWDNPDVDYFPFGSEDLPRGASCPELHVDTVWRDLDRDPWPESFETDHGTMILRSFGSVNESDRECDCHGRSDDADGWEFTGNSLDSAYPDCPRCEGSGYVESPAGRFAWYSLADE